MQQSNRYKIAVYAISKNEARFAKRWMHTMREADVVIVADTGSTDDTVSLLREAGAEVHRIQVTPWRFDKARNESLRLVPDDIDICVCTDLDEVWEEGWRSRLERNWREGTTRMLYAFTHGQPGQDTVYTWFWKEKIHTRHGYRWVRPVHEVLEYIGKGEERSIRSDQLRLYHDPDPHKSRSQYLPLLEQSVCEFPEDDRNMHYLGREYMYHGRWDECIATLQQHLAMPQARWADERSASMRFISRAYKASEQWQEATRWLYRAIAEAPYLREPYTEMAQLAYHTRNWSAVYHMVEEALRISTRPDTYMQEDFCWDATLYDLGALACYELGLLHKACEFAREATERSPDDSRLSHNYALIQSRLP
ncbi:tetratricopeptide repeat-containing glycosyltransferase [Paenibacillus sp. FSL P2-0173]|uniref:tetratricopeptide repeat-containing glycosyltransferase n=1 Tax=Paenibacillus sp. FSL P2-0173 TaxID=2921627 RepID=UPI0030F8603C